MNPAQIEQLISRAIENRPRVTNAPLNLYIYDGQLLCGARSVTPKDSGFVAYVHADTIENGFSDKQWKLVVEKTMRLLPQHQDASAQSQGTNIGRSSTPAKTEPASTKELRTEQRLQYRQPIWFSDELSKVLSQGQTFDISSRGISFNCYSQDSCLYPRQEISTRFSVPRINSNKKMEMLNFTRKGRICRIDGTAGSLDKIAVQFTDSLPFKPGEQGLSKDDLPERLKVPKAALAVH